MKKAMPYILSLLIVSLIMFLCGFYLGRNTNRYPIQLSTLPAPTDSSAAQTDSSEKEATEKKADGKVNVNTASIGLLQTLPGIGEVLARRIIDYREEYGPFSDLAGLLKVEGIGEKTLEALLDYATVGG